MITKLIRTVFYLPVRYNDGTKIPPKHLKDILNRVKEITSDHGITSPKSLLSGEWNGTWEDMKEYRAAIVQEKAEDLIRILKDAKELLKQYKLYFEYKGDPIMIDDQPVEEFLETLGLSPKKEHVTVEAYKEVPVYPADGSLGMIMFEKRKVKVIYDLYTV